MAVTVITGAGRGIGAAVALRLAREGHDLVVGYLRDEAAAASVVAAVRAEGVRAVAVGGDVSDEDTVARLFSAAAELGPVTGLVNNAGLTLHLGDLADTPVDVIRTVLDANLLGAVLCARAAVLAMSTRRGGAGGAIVNVSSLAATLGSPHDYVHYAAAKAGVDALTVGLAKEVGGEGIRVNAVSPGTVHTGIHAAAGDPSRADRAAEQVPAGRSGVPDDIAPAICWLLGPEAAYVSGAILKISGGR